MHFITSNLNILHSNKSWETLKKKNVIVDEDYDSFYLKLNSPKFLNKYKSFHIFIYLDIFNINKCIKILTELNKKI